MQLTCSDIFLIYGNQLRYTNNQEAVMARLYFVRHGLTKNNTLHRFNGSHANASLLPEGRIQATRLGEVLAETPFTGVYTSPQLRALETAEEIIKVNANWQGEIIQDSLLKEIDFGEWDGELLEDKWNHPQLKNLQYYPEKYDPSEFHGESYLALIDRGKQFLTGLAYGKEENHLIVAHGVLLTTLGQILQQKEISRIREDGLLANASLTTFETDGENFELLAWNQVYS